MVEKLRAPLHVALASISEIMSPGIFDDAMLRELQVRYKGKKEIIVPKAPEWHVDGTAEEEEDGSDDKGEKGENGPTVIPPYQDTEKAFNTAPTTANKRLAGDADRLGTDAHQENARSIPGLEYCPPDSPMYQRATTVLQQLISSSDIATSCFPGCHEYTLTPTALNSELSKRYTVSWHPVGRRALLLLLADGVFFIEPARAGRNDNNGNSLSNTSADFRVSRAHGMYFPSPTDLTKPQHRSLLDGVLVFDKEVSGGKLVPRYLASDIVAHEGGILKDKPFSQRVKFLLDGVYGARKRYTKYDYASKECFRFRIKDSFELRKTTFLLSTLLNQVAHDVDGLTFIPSDAPYRIATSVTTEDSFNVGKRLLVWKRADGDVPELDLVQRVKSVLG